MNTDRQVVRPKVLVVVSSSCQLYSGTGRALFDWFSFGRTRLDFSLLLDTNVFENYALGAKFCHDNDIRLFSSSGHRIPGCPDSAPSDAARIIRSYPWDAIECVSWASAATHLEVMANLPPSTPLLFTPHTQPLWTLPTPREYYLVMDVFHRMLRRANLVFTDSPDELDGIDGVNVCSGRRTFLPLGVDTRRFFAPPSNPEQHDGDQPQLLCVGDFREHRKRPDLVLRAFSSLCQVDDAVQLVLVGKGSDTIEIPGRLGARVQRLGYVTEDELLRRYHKARALLSLSDFEAFGLPIAEALCTGLPVIINRQEQTAGIFGGLPGVHWVDNADATEVREVTLRLLSESPARQNVADAAARQFGIEQTYRRKLKHLEGVINGVQGQTT